MQGNPEFAAEPGLAWKRQRTLQEGLALNYNSHEEEDYFSAKHDSQYDKETRTLSN